MAIWTMEDDEILINFVKNHEMLYNVKCKDYRKVPLKQNLWIEIGVILDKTDVDCSKRWNNVRDYYIKKKGTRGRVGTVAKQRSLLLSFLDGYSSTKKSSGTIVIDENNENINTNDIVAMEEDTHFDNEESDIIQHPEFLEEDETEIIQNEGRQNLGNKPQYMRGWSSKEDALLIDFVKNHEMLYNMKNKDYRQVELKQNLWCEIGGILNKTDVDCSKRWGYVRDYYVKRRGKCGYYSRGEAARRCMLLSFLDGCSSAKRSSFPKIVDENNETINFHETVATGKDSQVDSEESDIFFTCSQGMACWTSEEDKLLINFVKNHEILYNVRTKGYRNTQVKKNLWCEIGATLNKTGIQCNKRWAYVRDYYVKRRGNPTSREAARDRFELLSFLDGCSSSKRSSLTNVFGEENSEDINSNETFAMRKYTQVVNEAFDIVKHEFVEVEKDAQVENEALDNGKHEFLVENEMGTIHNKRRQNMALTRSPNKRKQSPSSEERSKFFKQIAQQEVTSVQYFDETDHFFMSMSKIVKKLPRYEQAQLRMKISMLVGNAELKCFSPQEGCSDSTSIVLN